MREASALGKRSIETAPSGQEENMWVGDVIIGVFPNGGSVLVLGLGAPKAQDASHTAGRGEALLENAGASPAQGTVQLLGQATGSTQCWGSWAANGMPLGLREQSTFLFEDTHSHF